MLVAVGTVESTGTGCVVVGVAVVLVAAGTVVVIGAGSVVFGAAVVSVAGGSEAPQAAIISVAPRRTAILFVLMFVLLVETFIFRLSRARVAARSHRGNRSVTSSVAYPVRSSAICPKIEPQSS